MGGCSIKVVLVGPIGMWHSEGMCAGVGRGSGFGRGVEEGEGVGFGGGELVCSGVSQHEGT